MKKAFTLIELLITMVVMAAVTGVFAWALFAGFDTWVSGKNRADLFQSADRAIETMVRWISQATSITAATASSITFTADIDGDVTIETVTFAVSGTNLQRTVGTSTVTMVPNTQSLGLIYTNTADTVIVPANQTDRDTIHIVTPTLTISLEGETDTLSSSVFCRNR